MRPVLSCSALALALALASCGGAPSREDSSTPAPDDTLAARVLDEELARVLELPRVRSALAVVVDPRDGRVVAMQSLDRGGRSDPERPARAVRSHGSVAKSLTIAAALDAGAIALEDTFAGGTYDLAGAPVRDFETHGDMTLADVVAFSSNVGTMRIYQRLGREPLLSALGRFRLAHRVPEGARADDALAARIAYGPALEATPLELATTYAALANDGVLHAPWRAGETPTPGERVISSETAAAVLDLLEGAVARDDGTGRRARVEGHRVAGKTGTMPDGDATHGAFVGIAPLPEPRFVILVSVVAEGDEYSGGTIAGPTFARIATRLL